MDKETLRMQLLAGLITESEYKAKINGNKPKLTEDEVDNILSKPGTILFPDDEEDYISQLHNLEDYINSKGKEWEDYEPILKNLDVDTDDFSYWIDSASDEEMEEVIDALTKYAKTL